MELIGMEPNGTDDAQAQAHALLTWTAFTCSCFCSSFESRFLLLPEAVHRHRAGHPVISCALRGEATDVERRGAHYLIAHRFSPHSTRTPHICISSRTCLLAMFALPPSHRI